MGIKYLDEPTTSSRIKYLDEEKDVGEIRAAKHTPMGDFKSALVNSPYGNLFLRNQPDPENEKRRALLASTINTATLGAPQAIAQYGLGGNLAPTKAPTQEMIGGLLGMASPMSLAGKAAGAIKGIGMGAKVARGAIGGGVFGAALPGTIEQRLSKGKWGAAVGGAVSFVSSAVPKLINLGGRKTAQAIAEKADKGMGALSQRLSDKYDDVLGAIKGKVNAKGVISDIQTTIDEFPEGANIGKLKSIIGRLDKVDDIDAKELFAIKKEIAKTIPRSIWNGISEGDAMSNAKEGLYWKLTHKLEAIGGEKYKGLTEEYKGFKQAERLARKMFYRQGVPSDVPLGGTYDIPTQKAIKQLSSQLKPNEQFSQQFEAWRRGLATKKSLAPIGGIGLLGYMAHKLVSRKLLEKNQY